MSSNDASPERTSQPASSEVDPQAPPTDIDSADRNAAATVDEAPSTEDAVAPELPPGVQDEEPLTVEEFAEEVHWHDMLLGLLVVLLALLLSFFKISNLELWRHLRTGEYIVANGVPETDLFSYTAEQRRWVNPNWLFAVGAYRVQQFAGFKGLVAAKVAAVVLMTLLLLSIRHRGATLWWTVMTTACGLVILNKEFQVSPGLFTYFAVAAQLAVFFQAQARKRTWMLWLLVPLQLVWANVDQRYYVGLALTAFVLAGLAIERLFAHKTQGRPEPTSRLVPTVAAVFVLSILACFLNPYDLKNPTGLAALRAPLEHHVLFTRGLPEFGLPFASTMSVFDTDYWSLGAYTWEEYGTLTLVLLALLSFGMNWRRFQLPRFLLFVGVLLMCLFMLQFLYLLALVSVVVLALNGQEWFLDRFGTQPRIELGWLIWSRGGRVLTVLSLVALFLYGASGQLRNSLGNDLGLGVDPQAADTFSAVAEQVSALPETARGFSFSRLPHDSNLLIACNYPDPVYPVFLDDRLELFRRGRPRPDTVTSVELAALPTSLDLPKAGHDATLGHKLARLPTLVVIPAKYADRFWFDPDEEELKLRGSLSEEELRDLLDLAVRQDDLIGLPQLRPTSQDYAGARRDYAKALRHLYARSRVTYDSDEGTLSIRGTMTPDDYAVLLSLSDDADYRVAVHALFERAQDLMITYLRLREVLFTDDKDVWEPIFDKYGITHLMLQLPAPPEFFGYNTFAQLAKSPNWQPVTPLSGSLALFIRADAEDQNAADYRDANRLDFQDLAYRQSPDAEVLEPAVSVQPYTWYFDWLWRSRHTTSEKLLQAWHFQRLAEQYLEPTTNEVAAFRLLTIRRIREALLENPGNPTAYLLLGDAYHKLLELEWLVLPHPLVGYGTAPTSLAHHNIRYYQLVAALNQAVAANPDLLEAHQLLALWYSRRDFVDLTLRHLQRMHELDEQNPEDSLLRIQEIAVLERRVNDMRDQLNAPAMRADFPLARAEYAFARGYPELALEQLAAPSGLDADSAPLYVRLCLETGQHEKALPVLERIESQPQLLADGQWEQLMGTVRLLQGNYAPAAEMWNVAIRRKEYRAAMDVLRGTGLLMRGLQSPTDLPGLWQGYGFTLNDAVSNLFGLMPLDRSTSYALLGMLYLETPFVSRATEPLQKALEIHPNNPLRASIVYYLGNLTGEELDPFGPAEYIQPEFASEPEVASEHEPNLPTSPATAEAEPPSPP